MVGQCVCRSRPGVFPGDGVYPWSLCVRRFWKVLSAAQAAAYFLALWEAYPEASACWDWKAQALWGFVCLRSQLKELWASNSHSTWLYSSPPNASEDRFVHICGYLKSHLINRQSRCSGLSKRQKQDGMLKALLFQEIYMAEMNKLSDKEKD